MLLFISVLFIFILIFIIIYLYKKQDYCPSPKNYLRMVTPMQQNYLSHTSFDTSEPEYSLQQLINGQCTPVSVIGGTSVIHQGYDPYPNKDLTCLSPNISYPNSTIELIQTQKQNKVSVANDSSNISTTNNAYPFNELVDKLATDPQCYVSADVMGQKVYFVECDGSYSP